MITTSFLGTQYKVKDEDRAIAVKLLAERASKIPTYKQARAAALRGGVSRVFPKFQPGMSTVEYVKHYYGANAYVFYGKNRTPSSARDSVSEFFQPLSDTPLFEQADVVVEEPVSDDEIYQA